MWTVSVSIMGWTLKDLYQSSGECELSQWVLWAGHWKVYIRVLVNVNFLSEYYGLDIRTLHPFYFTHPVLHSNSSSPVLPDSRQADALTTTSCSLTKKKALFPIALAAFVSTAITKRSTTTVTSTQYQLIQSYLGMTKHCSLLIIIIIIIIVIIIHYI